MPAHQFGPICPVCAGPLVVAEGGAGCVLCGHAVRRSPVPRPRSQWTRYHSPRRPRQLMLPIGEPPIDLRQPARGHERGQPKGAAA
jgi:hypothetical protein